MNDSETDKMSRKDILTDKRKNIFNETKLGKGKV